MKSYRAVLLGLPTLAMGCLWQTDLPADATSIQVDPSRELVVTDENGMSGPLARNQTNGRLSFQQALSAENQCEVACGSCAAYTLRPEAAPFRLIAVTNRTDLSVMPDRAADGGEGRLVFAITDGPGDDASSPSLPVTVA